MITIEIDLEVLQLSIYFTWIFWLAVLGIRYVLTDRRWHKYYRRINWWLFPLNIVVIVLVFCLWFILLKLDHKLFGFSWFSLIPIGSTLNLQHGGNIFTVWASLKYVNVFMCLLIMAQLPLVALYEECYFRLGTGGWFDALIRSFTFGMIHMVVGVPLGIAIALIFVGLFFTVMYYKGGVRLSTQTHFQYNLILITVALFVSINQSLK